MPQTLPSDLSTAPEDLVNRACDAIGYIGDNEADDGQPVGDLQQGTLASRVASRIYSPLRQQLLRAAHWRFARKQTNLLLVEDATIGQPVPGGFNYEYLLPSDCLQVLFVPSQSAQFVAFTTYSSNGVTAGSQTVTPAAMNGTNSDSFWSIQVGTILEIVDGINTEYVSVTAITATTFTATFVYAHPNPFNISGNVLANGTVPGTPNITSPFPVFSNPLNYPYSPAAYSVMTDTVTANWGVSQFGSGIFYGIGSQVSVIVTNVRAAMLVYTADIVQIDNWSPDFTECLVAALASRLCMALIDDKKLAMAVMGQQVQLAKSMLLEARRTNANEQTTTTQREAVWTRARRIWNYGGYGCGPPGNAFAGFPGYSSFSFADGSTL